LIAAAGCADAGAGSQATDAGLTGLDASQPDMPMFTPRAGSGGSTGIGRRGANAGAAGTSAAAGDSGPSEPEPPELSPQPGLRISLPNGKLWGLQVGGLRAFLGIPFGSVPQRFAPSQRAEPWSGTLDATRYGPACPQADNGLASHDTQDENCLTLDVYTPDDSRTKLPVMVFIHGGAFVAGATSQYDATQLAMTPMVVVAINYRLGALGFFAHPALDATRPDLPSGSDGIRDQQLALHWVRENIGAFNGDRERVTVFGESAGAISACVHWASPSSRGLAQRYIMQSGTCTIDGPGLQTKAKADELGMQMADALCPGQADQLACLRAKPAAELATWGGDMGLWGPLWQPTIEGEGGVLPDYPERLVARADKLAPFIVGTNKNEWGFFEQVAGAVTPKSVADLNSTIASAFGEHADMIREHYSTTDDAEANDVWMRLVTDMSFRCPTRTLARLADSRGASTWLYSFEQGPAYHAYELDYVFGGDWVSSNAGVGPPSAALIGVVQRYWTRFAATGDPNGEADPAWPRFQTASDQHMVLVDPPHQGSALASAECDFWRSYWREGGTVDLR
jgi:para-nitrobenzyl esterase